MSDPKPTLLKFYLQHNDDEELTCFFCGLHKCDQFFEARGDGKIQWIGVHSGCVDRHTERQTKTTAKPGEASS